MAPGACVARTLFLMEPVASLVEPPKHEWLNHHGNRRKQPHQAAFD
jgi:hypothetical protein